MTDAPRSTSSQLREQLRLLSIHADPSAVAAVADQLAAAARDKPDDAIVRAAALTGDAVDALAHDRGSTEARDRLTTALRVLRMVSTEKGPTDVGGSG